MYTLLPSYQISSQRGCSVLTALRATFAASSSVSANPLTTCSPDVLQGLDPTRNVDALASKEVSSQVLTDCKSRWIPSIELS